MMLGHDERTNQGYEGDAYSGYGVLPLAALSLATLIRNETNFAAIPIGCELFSAELLLRKTGRAWRFVTAKCGASVYIISCILPKPLGFEGFLGVIPHAISMAHVKLCLNKCTL